MRLTLEQKQEVVRLFKGGKPIFQLAAMALNDEASSDGKIGWSMPLEQGKEIIANVLRDYINGKFTLKRKATK